MSPSKNYGELLSPDVFSDSQNTGADNSASSGMSLGESNPLFQASVSTEQMSPYRQREEDKTNEGKTMLIQRALSTNPMATEIVESKYEDSDDSS